MSNGWLACPIDEMRTFRVYKGAGRLLNSEYYFAFKVEKSVIVEFSGPWETPFKSGVRIPTEIEGSEDFPQKTLVVSVLIEGKFKKIPSSFQVRRQKNRISLDICLHRTLISFSFQLKHLINKSIKYYINNIIISNLHMIFTAFIRMS